MQPLLVDLKTQGADNKSQATVSATRTAWPKSQA